MSKNRWVLIIAALVVVAIVMLCCVACNNKNNNTPSKQITVNLHNTLGPTGDRIVSIKLKEGDLLSESAFNTDNYICVGVYDKDNILIFDTEALRWNINVFDDAFLGKYATQNNAFNVDLYIHWQPIQITVRLYDEDHPTEEYAEIQRDYGTELPSSFVVPTPQNSDYQFDGWYNGNRKVTDSNGIVINPVLLADNYKIVDASVLLEAHYSPRIAHVYFEYGMANIPHVIKSFEFGHVLTNEDYPVSVDIDDQEVVGWSLSSSYYIPCTEPLRQEAIMLYANWKHFRVIEFYDGELLLDTARVYAGEDSILHDGYKKGYYLEGWYNNPELSGNPVRINYSSPQKLYGRWEIATYNVTFMCDEVIAPITYQYGDVYEFASLQKEGYRFDGWTRQDSDDNTILTSTKELASDLILVPAWTPNRYIVTCYVDGARLKSVTIDHGSKIDIGIAEKTGYDFIGWFDSSAEDAMAYTNRLGIGLTNWNTVVESEIKMFAHFSIKTFQVRYETNGGTLIEPQTYSYGSTVAFPREPDNSNGFFDGWFFDDALTSACNGSVVVEKDFTLYAHWVDGKYINSYADLLSIEDNPDTYYKLACDINLLGNEWTPIGQFNGTLNGAGHKIFNFQMTIANQDLAFIQTNNGTIKNVVFEDVIVNQSLVGSNRTAVVAATNNGFLDNIIIDNVSLSYTVNILNAGVGFADWGILVADNKESGLVNNCLVTATQKVDFRSNINNKTGYTAYLFVGAIATNSGIVSNITVKSTLNSYVWAEGHKYSDSYAFYCAYYDVHYCAGGIAGANQGTTSIVQNCSSNLNWDVKHENCSYNASAQDRRIGGIVGNNSGTVQQTQSSGSIRINNSGSRIEHWALDVGGIVGELASGKVDLVNSTMSLSLTNTVGHGSFGGIVGHNGKNTSLTNASFSGSLNGTYAYAIGGIIGNNESTISNCVYKGTYTCSNTSYNGPIVGYNNTTGFANKYIIWKDNYTGNGVGQNNGSINKYFVINKDNCATLLTQEILFDGNVFSADIWGISDGLAIYLKAFANHEHDFGDIPACQVRYCTITGCGYVANPMEPHRFLDYQYNHDATCSEDGTETASCIYGCGSTDTRIKIGSALGHRFISYQNNNDATCTTDATETAICENGCGTTDTRTQPNTARGHYFIMGRCVRCEAYSPELIASVNEVGYYFSDIDGNGDYSVGDYVYCGFYPQSAKSAHVTISNSPNENGYYKGSDDNNYLLENGVYYMIEPIQWVVLDCADGKISLTTKKVIEASAWQIDYNQLGDAYYNTSVGTPADTYANNYAYSTIRSFLNNGFYDMAFSATQKDLLVSVNVDNSARSGNPDSNAQAFNEGNNDYACEDTIDKVFLLSEREVTSNEYGFNAAYSLNDYDIARQKQATDYAVAKGAPIRTEYGVDDFSIWWLRSAVYSNSAKVASVSYKAKGEVPSDAIEFNGHYYKYYSNKLTWSNAKTYCENLGGHLATLTTAEENSFVQTSVYSGACWIGATDEATEGTWVWVTGEPWSYTNWKSGEPNNDSNEDYLELTSGWNDNKGSATMGFVCEWDAPNGNETEVGSILGIVPAIVLNIQN